MKVINTLTKGIMNKSTDKSLVPQDFHIDAENLRFGTTKNNDGIGKSIKGTLKVSDSTDDNSDYKCICATFNKKKDTILYFLATTDGMLSKIVEFNTNTNVTVNVTEDNRGVLKFDKNGYITGVNVIDDLLVFSEWGNNIRRINIERSKNYGLNGFEEEDITLIVKPPYTKPTLNLQTTTSDSQEENNIEEKFIVFSYRWRYLDGEYSALAPFTLPAFEPKKFEYDYSVQSNKSMVNKYNEVEIGFNTGGKNVTEIQLVFKESGDNEVFIINDFDKSLLNFSDNSVETFNFSNFNSIRGLSKNELRKMFDNVPRTSKCQTIIDGRLIFANYKENYNIVDTENNKIKIDYKLNLDSKEISQFIPKKTAKSNRDYEVVIGYADEFLRTTTLLKSLNNTLFVPNNLSVKENTIDVILKNKPPSFAKYFKFFIKQTKRGYEQILPTLFYEDGVYRWIKLEESDKDKIQKGKYLIVKSDTQGNLNVLNKVKVLDVASQERNFLEDDDETELKQQSGLYFKIKPLGFRLNIEDIRQETFTSYEDNLSDGSTNPIGTNIHQIEQPCFYGTSALNDLESLGTYTYSEDLRYVVVIDAIGDGTSTFNTFKWSKDGGSNFIAQNVVITQGVSQTLDNGVQIKFGSNTGHDLNDNWIISAKSPLDNALGHDEDAIGYAIFKSPLPVIEGGARISIIYDEYDDEKQYIEKNYISSRRYKNLEEWFHGDNIIDSFGIPENRIWFRRGNVIPHGWRNRSHQINMTTDGTGDMAMIIKSLGYEKSNFDDTVRIKVFISITDGSNPVILETEPTEQPSDVFYEIGKTYRIENDFHLGDGPDDINQTISNDLKIKLDWFNAFSYGNGVESYKIKDEFNSRGIDVGTRVSSTSKQEYKETIRTEDVTWSDVYNADASFNGLNSFNLSLINFLPLDRENGSIQKIYNKNSNLIILQEDGIGRIPYNKNIIYDTQGGKVVGISTNILNKESYFSYGAGKHGISKNPEGFVSDGFRDYFPDKQRGAWLRLSNDGITPISQNFYDHEFSDLMIANKYNNLIAGFDPKHKEILLYTPNENKCLTFKEKSKGLPNKFTFEPDFMIHANNELYSWKNGIMYKHNQTELANDFYGIRYDSKLKLIVNHQFGYEKIFKALGLYSTHSWLVKLKTRLSARDVPKDSFRKINDYWFSEIMGDTSDNIENNSIFGIGSYPIIGGVISVQNIPASISVGDFVKSKSLLFPASKITEITENSIILETNITTIPSFLMYSKNQNVDGGNIKGDFMEVELISDETKQVEIRALKTEVEIINK